MWQVSVKVLIAEAQAGWTRFHRDPLCSGLRKGELADGANYVERHLEDLPDTVKPCQFPCCFQGYKSAQDLRAKVHDRPATQPASGVRVGQEVEFRQLGETKTTRVRIVHGAADRDKGELSKDTPIAQGLLGHEPGDVFDVPLPRRVMRVEIVNVI